MKKPLSILTILVIMILFSPAIHAEEDIYQFKVKTIQGQEKNLSEYKGKVLLIVNTASKCGFTPQYDSLEKLYEKYRDKGFEVLAFPANNFMHQEPGNDEEIEKFCNLRFHIHFPLFSKIDVKGKQIHPLYQYLTTQPGFSGPITWNFNKFLISPEGKVIARFGTKVEPLSDEIGQKIEAALPVKK